MTGNYRQKTRKALLFVLAAQIGAGPLATSPFQSHSPFPSRGGGAVWAQDFADGQPWAPAAHRDGAYLAQQPATEQQLAHPQEHSAVVRTIELPAAFIASVSTSLELRYRNTPGVQISPDVRGSRLIILAPESMQRQIQHEAMLFFKAESEGSRQTAPSAATGTESAGGAEAAGSSAGRSTRATSAGNLSAPTTRSANGSMKVRLGSITWREFEDSLHRLAGKRLPVTTSQNGERATFQLVGAPLEGTNIEVDRRDNIVTVVAPEPAMPGWKKMIGSLDQSSDRPDDVIEMVRIVHAKPAPIQRAIRLLDNLPADQSATILPTTPGREPFRSAAFQQPLVPQAPAQPNQPQQPALQPGQQPVQPGEEPGGIIGDTQIQFVPELGIIIVRGARRDAQRVLEVIRQIEEQAVITQPEVEIYQLQHLNGSAAAALLNQLYIDVLAARQGEVNITPLDHPNALLMIGRREALANAINLIEKLDQPLDAASRLQVFRLVHTSAVDAEQTVRNFFVDRPGVGDDLRPGLGTRVRILAEYRTNSLIVGASPRDLIEVANLIRQLDVEKTPAQNEIKVFPLRNSLAADLAPVLQAAIAGQPEVVNENITPPSTSLSIVALDSASGGVLSSGILSGVVVTADANANAIVVRGPSSSMSLIGELIRQLDQVPGIESLVKVFTIENGDAVQLSAALQQLFAQAAGAGVGQANLAGLTAAPTSSLVNLRFSVDARTNSIIASGSASDLDVVESILLRLDTTGFAERITEVVWLRHQSALEIATAIEQYVAQRTQSIQRIPQFQPPQGLGPFDLPDRDLIVVAEVETNSLLLSVSPRLYPDVRRLIDSLDRRPPMVLIKVVIAEVLLDDLFELGGEVGLQDSLLFDRGRALTTPGAGTPGFNFNNAGTPNVSAISPGTVGSRAVSTFGLGTTSTAAGFGGFVLSAASDSFNLLFRALQNANRAQILSRPQIMTVDNKVGYINVGQRVARVTGLQTAGLGVPPILAVSDIDVGLSLEVRPRVGADGLISMLIVAARSEVDNVNPGTPIGTDPNNVPIFVPNINETRAESNIVAYSGQTVIFGGLIQKIRAVQSRRVPYLADIPLIGVMFRFDRESETRSELLVIMTPMLISGDEDLEYVKQTESSRMSYCIADVVEMHGDVGLSGGYGLWGPAIGPTIYPDLHPTVDQFPIAVDGEFYGEKIYGKPTIIDGPVPLGTPGPVEMLTPPQQMYPAPQTPLLQLPQPPAPGTPSPELGPSVIPQRFEQATGSMRVVPQPYGAPAAAATSAQRTAAFASPSSAAPAIQGAATMQMQRAPRVAATAMPPSAPPARFVKPADFQFIDGDAAAELSGFAK